MKVRGKIQGDVDPLAVLADAEILVNRHSGVVIGLRARYQEDTPVPPGEGSDPVVFGSA